MLDDTTLICGYVIAFSVLAVLFWLDHKLRVSERDRQMRLTTRMTRLLIDEAENVTKAAMMSETDDE